MKNEARVQVRLHRTHKHQHGHRPLTKVVVRNSHFCHCGQTPFTDGCHDCSVVSLFDFIRTRFCIVLQGQGDACPLCRTDPPTQAVCSQTIPLHLHAFALSPTLVYIRHNTAMRCPWQTCVRLRADTGSKHKARGVEFSKETGLIVPTY